MSEWLKEHAWKACVGETLPWVRIPLSPPFVLPGRGATEAVQLQSLACGSWLRHKSIATSRPEYRLNSQVSGGLARDLSRRWNSNVPSQADLLEQLDLKPSEIELESPKSVACRSGMGMMIVVPTFTKGK